MEAASVPDTAVVAVIVATAATGATTAAPEAVKIPTAAIPAPAPATHAA